MVVHQSGSKHVEVYDRGKRTSCFHAQVVRCQTDRELGAGWESGTLVRSLVVSVGRRGWVSWKGGFGLCHRDLVMECWN